MEKLKGNIDIIWWIILLFDWLGVVFVCVSNIDRHLLTSLNSATCFCENIENTLEPARLARLEDEPPDLDDWRVDPDGDFGVAAADAGVAAGVSSGVASAVAPSSFTFFTFLTFFSFSDCKEKSKSASS